MSDPALIAVKPNIAATAHVNAKSYAPCATKPRTDPNHFWAEQAKRIAWIKPPTIIKNTSFEGDVQIKWFEDGVLNASAVCLDAHLPTRANQTAIIFEGDDPGLRATSPIANCTTRSAVSPTY